MMQQITKFDCKKSSKAYELGLYGYLFEQKIKKAYANYKFEENYICKTTDINSYSSDEKSIAKNEKIEYKHSNKIIRLV